MMCCLVWVAIFIAFYYCLDRLQNESLKKEIVDQESSFKIQIANIEQKCHENWVSGIIYIFSSYTTLTTFKMIPPFL